MARAHFRDAVVTNVTVAGEPVSVLLTSATVNVYEDGTTTPIAVTMYDSDSGGSTLSNPLTASATTGEIEFWLDEPRRVDLKITKSGYTTRTVTVDVQDSGDEEASTDVARTFTATQTFATTTTTTGQFKGTPTFDVKAYGAVGDNSTDDTTSLAAALTAASSAGGGIVFVPDGIYRYTGLTLPDNTEIQGVGSKVSVLRYSSTSGNGISLGSNHTNGKLRKIGLDCVTTSSGNAVNGATVREFVLDDYEIQGFLKGVAITDSLNCTVGTGRLIGQGKATAGGIGIDVNGNLMTIGQAYVSTYETGIKTQGNAHLLDRTIMESCTTGLSQAGFATLVQPYWNANTTAIAVASGGFGTTIIGPTFFDATQARNENLEGSGGITYGDASSKSRTAIIANFNNYISRNLTFRLGTGQTGDVLKIQDSGGSTTFAVAVDGAIGIGTSPSSANTTQISSGNHIAFGTGAGSKIGTSATQKIGFWNATPAVQPTAVADAAGGATVDAEARTALNALLARLRTIGVIAT